MLAPGEVCFKLIMMNFNYNSCLYFNLDGFWFTQNNKNTEQTRV